MLIPYNKFLSNKQNEMISYINKVPYRHIRVAIYKYIAKIMCDSSQKKNQKFINYLCKQKSVSKDVCIFIKLKHPGISDCLTEMIYIGGKISYKPLVGKTREIYINGTTYAWTLIYDFLKTFNLPKPKRI